MADQTQRQQFAPIQAGYVDGLLASAARAPSILNSQPWAFRVTAQSIELYADPSRRLRGDQGGREMLISCGAALFGLRLAIRALGLQPIVTVLPDPDRPALLARIRLGGPAPMTQTERAMFEAMPHRHTHRGAFAAEPLPPGLLIGMQHDAVAERATLALIDQPVVYSRLAGAVALATKVLDSDDTVRADIRQWVRLPGSAARDGVPASAIAVRSGAVPGKLAQRDLDLGRGIAMIPCDSVPPAATVVLLTQGDTRADWIRAGQALHRMLARAAAQWTFASLHSLPLEAAPTRTLVRSTLGVPGAPQLLLQLGLARTAQSTPRRPPAELITPGSRLPRGTRPARRVGSRPS